MVRRTWSILHWSPSQPPHSILRTQRQCWINLPGSVMERTLRNISAADGRCTMYRRHVQLYRYTHHQHSSMQSSSQCRNSSLLSKCSFMTPNAFNLTVTRRSSSRCHVCMSMSSMQLQSKLPTCMPHRDVQYHTMYLSA